MVPQPKPTVPGAPGLAYRNTEFLDSDDGRPLRILAEYLHPLQRFRQQGVRETIVFFGSARLRPDGPLGRYHEDARKLARLVTEWMSRTRAPSHQCLICSGGGGGMMEAANQGAAEAGGRTIGLNIGLPHEQHPNRYITPELSFQFHYFFMRKLWFGHLARAIVAFPGGFGTMDELFEMLTLSQTGKLSRPIPVLLYGSAYWNEIINFRALVKHGVIGEEDLRLFRFVDDPEEALRHLKSVISAEGEPREPGFARSVVEDGRSGSARGGSPDARKGESK